MCKVVIILDKAPSKKAKIFCWILVITVSVICLLIGFVEMSVYTELKDKCSSEVTGTVIYEGTGRIYDTDKAENKYVSGKYFRQIEVETDGKFKLKNIYAKRGAEKKGDNITIHYDPNDPDTYYIGDNVGNYKSTAIFSFAASGILPVFLIFIMLKSDKYYKLLAQKQRKYIYFDTPYCRFLFTDSGDVGFEGEVEWEYNLTGEKTCTVFFETDTFAATPDIGYYGLIEKRLPGKEEIDLDINKLIPDIPELRDIQPGKYYNKLEKILSDKERRDHEIRKLVADHFLFRPELIKEKSTEQEIMDGIELSYIGVRRNGDTEFGIFFASDIYVDDLRVILKADGSKEIHYRTDDHRGTNDECCDVL